MGGFEQLSLFSGDRPRFKIDKAIRIIELFSGYGSQSLALKYLGVPFEHWTISEWAVKSIQAYKDMHFPDDNTDYSKDMTVEEIREYLKGRISSDYSNPIPDKTIDRMKEDELRKIINNMRATRNCGSIVKMSADDLGIVDADKYCYIMTYSFPCQSLSKSGKQEGMRKGSGTRSGMLWEVERLLREIHENGKSLPQVLLMENVPDVVGNKFFKDFILWTEFLQSIGYTSKYFIDNAKYHEIPQNRERCFMVSVLGDYEIGQPATSESRYVLKDFLEVDVDEKYYLTEDQVREFLSSQNVNVERERERETSRAVRTGGRGSLDRHLWDLVVETDERRERRNEQNDQITVPQCEPSEPCSDGLIRCDGRDRRICGGAYPINALADGTSATITASYGKTSFREMFPEAPYALTGVVEVLPE